MLWAVDLSRNEVVLQEVVEPETSQTQKGPGGATPAEKTRKHGIGKAEIWSRQRPSKTAAHGRRTRS